MVQSVFSFGRRVLQHRTLLRNMVVRDLRSRYVGSFMGLFWAVVQPLASLLVYTYVFSVVLKVRLDPSYATDSFALWIFCGLLPWLVFADTVGRSATILLENRNLITKTVFPSEILPFAVLLANVINHVFGLAILLLAVLFYRGYLNWVTLLLPVYMLPMILLSLGLSWLTASLTVFLRDMGQLVPVLLNICFYLTPVVYPPEFLPGNLRVLVYWNPIAFVVSAYRQLVLAGRLPDSAATLGAFGVSLLCCVAGALFFRRTKAAFADVM